MTEYERGQTDMRERAQKLCYNMDDEIQCSACSGSGYYDHSGSPRCGSCRGSGEVKATPNDAGYAIGKLEIVKGKD